MPYSHEPTRGDKLIADALFAALLTTVVACRRERTLSGKVLAVLGGVRSIGLELIRLSLEEQDKPNRARGAKVRCPKCGTLARKLKGLKRRQRYTLLGKVEHRRARFECTGSKCCHTFSPLDEELGLDALHRGHSREFVKELVLFCTVMSFEKGCEFFRRAHGFTVSHTLGWQLAFRIGQKLTNDELLRAKILWGERLTVPEKFEPTPHMLRQMKREKRVYVMSDNSKMPMQLGKRGRKAKKKKAGELADPWRDARALLIFKQEDLASNSTGKRRLILKRRVVSHIGSLDEWYRLVFMAFYEEGVFWAHEVVIVNDGGIGIWEMFDELLPSTERRRVVQILDWYHAVQHLWTVGRLLKGVTKQGDVTNACSQWVRGLIDYLERGEVSNVLQRLRKIKKGTNEAKEKLADLIKYFEKHTDRMRYAAYRKAGMLIGSGAIESVHNWVIQARCRLPGMRWSVEGANAMLRLRCAWASDHWDDIFKPSADNPALAPSELRAAA
jgi:hypothetical protein